MTKLTGTALLQHDKEAKAKKFDQLDTIEKAGWVKEDGSPDILGYMNARVQATQEV